MRHGSVSSEVSLTWSESTSSDGDSIKTPPETPRDSSFTFAESPISIQDSEEEICFDMSDAAAVNAFQQLDLTGNPFASPDKAVKAASISEWAAKLTLTSPSSPKSSPLQPKRRPGLKMDFSSLPSFNLPMSRGPSSSQLINAPLIGCLPSPSPTRMDFSPMTPRPTLMSRFSDESSSSSEGAQTPPEIKMSLLPSPSNLKVQALAMGSTGPMTPRTVDALDCFGISSSASSCLMGRGKSRDKLSTSPTLGRSLPRSPLAMPPSNYMGHHSFTSTALRSPELKRELPVRFQRSYSNPYFASSGFIQ